MLKGLVLEVFVAKRGGRHSANLPHFQAVLAQVKAHRAHGYISNTKEGEHEFIMYPDCILMLRIATSGSSWWIDDTDYARSSNMCNRSSLPNVISPTNYTSSD